MVTGKIGGRRSLRDPPGYWHSHHNEFNGDANVPPIQDAGMHTYLRTLDIAFSNRGRADSGALSNTPKTGPTLNG